MKNAGEIPAEGPPRSNQPSLFWRRFFSSVYVCARVCTGAGVCACEEERQRERDEARVSERASEQEEGREAGRWAALRRVERLGLAAMSYFRALAAPGSSSWLITRRQLEKRFLSGAN